MRLSRVALEDLFVQAAMVAVSSVLFAVIILITLATSWAEFASDSNENLSWWAKVDVGTTILVVRVLQGLLTVIATAAICSAFTRLHWRGMEKREGLRLVDLMALSPTTLFSGAVRVILSADSGRKARIWASVRYVYL